MKYLTYLAIASTAFNTILWGLAGFSFKKSEKEKHPIFNKLQKKRCLLLLGAIIFTIITALAWAGVEKARRNQLKIMDQLGIPAQTGTYEEFEKELVFYKPAIELSREAKNYYKAGIADIEGNRIQEAARNFEKSVKIVPTKNSYLNLGVCRTYLFQTKEAEHALYSGLNIAIEEEDLKFQSAFYLDLGNNYAAQSKFQDAIDSYKKALAISQEVNSWEKQTARILVSMSFTYITTGKLEEAEKQLCEALELNKRVSDPLNQANAINNIGLILEERGQRELALNKFNQALKIGYETSNMVIQANALNNIGLIYKERDEIDNAVDSFHKSLNLSKEAQYLAGQVNAYVNLGYISKNNLDYDKALENLNKGRGIAEKADMFDPLALIDLCMGEIYRNKAEKVFPLDLVRLYEIFPIDDIEDKEEMISLRDEALNYYEMALASFEASLRSSRKIDHLNHQCMALLMLGGVYKELTNYSKAVEVYQTALEVCAYIDRRLISADNLGQIAEVFFDSGEVKEALSLYERAAEIYAEGSKQFKRAVMLRMVGQIRLTLKELDGALKALHMSRDIFQQSADSLKKELLDDPLFELRDFSSFMGCRTFTSENLGEEFDSLIRAYKKVKSARVRLYLEEEKGETLLQLGYAYYSKRNLPEALKTYRSALETFEDGDKLIRIARAHYGLGSVYAMQGERREASKHLRNARELLLKTGEYGVELDYVERAIESLNSQIDN